MESQQRSNPSRQEAASSQAPDASEATQPPRRRAHRGKSAVLIVESAIRRLQDEKVEVENLPADPPATGLRRHVSDGFPIPLSLAPPMLRRNRSADAAVPTQQPLPPAETRTKNAGSGSGSGSGSEAVCPQLLLKDAEAVREFTEGMSKYFDGNDSGATIHFSRTVEMRLAVQEDADAYALFEDDAVRQRHQRQLRHAKLCLDDMANEPAEVASGAEEDADDDGDLLVEFVSASTRRMKMMEKSREQGGCEADSGCSLPYSLPYSLPKGYELEDDESTCSSDSFLFDAQVNRRLACAMNTPPAMLKGDSDTNCWQPPVKQMEMGKPPLAHNGKLPEEIELFMAKANSSVAAFHNSCVSDLCWDSITSFNLGGEDLKDLCWAVSKQTARDGERPMFPPMKRSSAVRRASAFSRAA